MRLSAWHSPTAREGAGRPNGSPKPVRKMRAPPGWPGTMQSRHGHDDGPVIRLKAPAYHTRQALALTNGWPALQENACWNSGVFWSTPPTR